MESNSNLRTRVSKFVKKIKSDHFFSKLIKNFVVALFGEFGAAVLGLGLTVILIVYLGDENYGMLMVAYSFMLIIDKIINFQSWQGIIKFGSESIEEEDFDELHKVIKTGILLDMLTALFGTILALSISGLIAHLFDWNNDILNAMRVFSLIIVFNFTGTPIGVLRLLDKFRYFSAFRIIQSSLKLVGVVIVAFVLQGSFLQIALVMFIADSLGYLVLQGFFLHTVVKSDKLSLKKLIVSPVKLTWKRFLKFSFWTNITTTADVPVQQLDIIIISTLSFELVAVYKVYKQIIQAFSKVTVPLSQAVMPQFSELTAKKEYSKAYGYLVKIRNHSLKLLIPLSLLIIGAAYFPLKYFLGDLYVEYSYILLIYLLIRAIALSFTSVHPLLISLGFVKYNFLATLFANAVYLTVASLLVSHFNLIGVMIALALQICTILYLKLRKIKSYTLENNVAL